MIAGYSTLWDLLLVDGHHLVASGPLLSPSSDGLLFTRYLIGVPLSWKEYKRR